jgi:hypothetical protein
MGGVYETGSPLDMGTSTSSLMVKYQSNHGVAVFGEHAVPKHLRVGRRVLTETITTSELNTPSLL